MSYRALYRQYRPATFGEMVGQEHIIRILKNQVSAGQTAHAYLFAGTRGTGKTSAAKILARAVNCETPENGEPCGKCAACLKTTGESADIIELDAASNNGVDDVRDIIDKARFLPLDLKTKVYIIDEAHALSPNAFNALLKTLEEPPAHAMFILATTEPQKIPATIISRCQRMNFHRLSVDIMVKRLAAVLQKEGAEIEQEGLVAIARAAEGGMRDCLSLADQCLSFCGNKVSLQDVYSVLGSMEDGFLYQMADAVIDGDPSRALQLLDRVVNEGRDLKVFIHDMALHMRALLITKLCGRCADILECTDDAMKRYEEQAKRAGQMQLLRANELLLQAENRLKTVTLPRVLIESTLVRIARPEEKLLLDDLAERVEKLEQQVREGVRVQQVAAPAPAVQSTPVPVYDEEPEYISMPQEDLPPFDIDEPVVKKAPKPAPAPAPAPKVVPAEQSAPAKPVSGSAKELWKAVQDKLYGEDKSLAVIAMSGRRSSLEGTVLEVGFASQLFHTNISKAENQAKVQKALDEVAPGYTIRFVLDSGDSLESRGSELFGSAFRVMD